MLPRKIRLAFNLLKGGCPQKCKLSSLSLISVDHENQRPIVFYCYVLFLNGGKHGKGAS
jgi:hypothetical protein